MFNMTFIIVKRILKSPVKICKQFKQRLMPTVEIMREVFPYVLWISW
jgi:hypothetical protein